jgi:hypothetical protein
MTWVTTVTLAGILVINLFKLLSVSAKLISFMPLYWQSVRHNFAFLENEQTRGRLENAFKEIFFSIQMHALN